MGGAVAARDGRWRRCAPADAARYASSEGLCHSAEKGANNSIVFIYLLIYLAESPSSGCVSAAARHLEVELDAKASHAGTPINFIFSYLSLILHSFSASCYFAMRFPHGHDRDRHSRKGRRHRGRATRSPVRLFTFSLSLLTLSNRSYCTFFSNRRQASERGVRLAALIIVLTPENAPPLRPLSAFYNVFCRSFPDTFNTLLTHFSS